MQAYRHAYTVEGTGRRLSQEGLLSLMGQANPKYLDRYDRSTVARWESGEIRPTRERIEVFGRALNLSSAEVQGLVALAGLEPEARTSARDAVTAVDGIASGALSRPGPEEGKASDGPGIQSHAGGAFWLLLSKFLLPGAAIAGVGYFLALMGWSADWMITVYMSVVIAIVLSHYFLRLRRSNELRDLFFTSIFVLLSTPLLNAPLIRMDPYGFYAVDGLANTPIPFVLALLVNLLLALTAGLMFDFLFRWQTSRGSRNPYRRAAWVSLPPLAFVYACALVLCPAGHWVYLLEAFPVLGGVFIAMLVLRDEGVRLSEWAKRFLLQTSMAITIVLTGVGLAGLVVVYWDPSLLFMPDHTLIRSWEVDFDALGYAPGEFMDRARMGIVWSTLSAIIYMVVVIGGSLMVTIYRKDSGDSADPAAETAAAVAPSRRRRTKAPRIDVRYRPGWLVGHRILQPPATTRGLSTIDEDMPIC